MTHVSRPIDALHAADASVRLRAAMSAGTRPEDRDVPVLLARCAVEPDFFVRDMLTWALTRHPVSHTLPLLVAELGSPHAQARSQALHTLSKLKEAGAWPAVSDFLHDPDDEVARAAWRAAVVLAPRGARAELVAELVRELGRGDRDVQLSLSHALLALSDGTPAVDHASGAAGAAADTVAGMLAEAQGHPEARVRAHAVATQRLLADPDAEFGAALDEATRVAIDRAAPAVR